MELTLAHPQARRSVTGLWQSIIFIRGCVAKHGPVELRHTSVVLRIHLDGTGSDVVIRILSMVHFPGATTSVSRKLDVVELRLELCSLPHIKNSANVVHNDN